MLADLEQAFSVTANGEVAQPLGGHAARYYRRPDLTYRQFRQDWTISWGPIWQSENENPGIRHLTAAVTDLGPRRL